MREGTSARVKTLLNDGSMRRRLQDMGLIEGTSVLCLQRSPSGDPIAYLIRGAVIALRRGQFKNTGRIKERSPFRMKGLLFFLQ